MFDAPELPPFLDQLVDWRAFERFVRDLYAQDANLEVEHDVTEQDWTGAKRQTDVKFTHYVQGIKYVTLVECKKWKQKVTRRRIDELVQNVNELQASKGVMFTTKGFERGAEQYAKGKGVELFIVRDMTDDEWGAPGRFISFWMHYYNAHFHDLNAQGGLLSFLQPPQRPNMNFNFGKDVPLDPRFDLRSLDMKETRANLVTVLMSLRSSVMTLVSEGIDQLIPGGEDARRAIEVPIEIDFSKSPRRSLIAPMGRFDLEEITAKLLVTVHQTQFKMDRGMNLDIALAVEHYVTKQKQVVIRPKDDDRVGVFQMDDAEPDPERDDVLTPNTLFRLMLAPYVNPESVEVPVEPGNIVRFEVPSDGSDQWRTTVRARDDPKPS